MHLRPLQQLTCLHTFHFKCFVSTWFDILYFSNSETDSPHWFADIILWNKCWKKKFYQRNFDHQQKEQIHLKLSHISILASFRGRIRALMVSQPLIWTQQTAGSPSCLNLIIITGILSRNPHTSFLLNALMLIFTSVSLLDTCLWQWGVLVVQPSFISVIGVLALKTLNLQTFWNLFIWSWSRKPLPHSVWSENALRQRTTKRIAGW